LARPVAFLIKVALTTSVVARSFTLKCSKVLAHKLELHTAKFYCCIQ
jgi:hypothetical protein